VGFIHFKALLDVGQEARKRPVDPRLLLPVLTVPADRHLNAVLAGMRQRRTHIALVVDGRSRVIGLLTLQDVLQTLVGQIREERRRRA
jgi:CBS domain containing-hemolysin-like protein